MRTHVALLRGVNVGGHNKVSMADLRDVVASLGHTDVATYVQSGNVVFSATDPNAATPGLADAIKTAIADRLSVRSPVVVVSRQQLRQVIEQNPFPEESNPKAVHAVFSSLDPGATRIAAIADAVKRAEAKGCTDQARVVGRTLYLWTPDGFGRSKLAEELARADRATGDTGTARNWATVLALARLLDE